MMTIVGLAQNFVGSNNLNLLQPLGQFGTRLHGGKDSASPRYIFTMLRSVASLQTTNHHKIQASCTHLVSLGMWGSYYSVINFSPNFLSFQPSCPPSFPSCGWQPAQVQLWWQPARRARVVYTHHPHCASERCRRYRHRLGQQDPQLRLTRDHQQHPPHA